MYDRSSKGFIQVTVRGRYFSKGLLGFKTVEVYVVDWDGAAAFG